MNYLIDRTYKEIIAGPQEYEILAAGRCVHHNLHTTIVRGVEGAVRPVQSNLDEAATFGDDLAGKPVPWSTRGIYDTRAGQVGFKFRFPVRP